MINILEIQKPFRDRIKNSGIFTDDQIAWENIVFTPSQKDLWCEERYLAIDEGRVTSEGDRVDGIFQYSVHIPINHPQGSTLAIESGVALGNLFTSSEIITTDNYTISIQSTKCSFQGKLDDKWYSYIVDIAFQGFE